MHFYALICQLAQVIYGNAFIIEGNLSLEEKSKKNNLAIFISPDEVSMRINERISLTVVIT